MKHRHLLCCYNVVWCNCSSTVCNIVECNVVKYWFSIKKASKIYGHEANKCSSSALSKPMRSLSAICFN